MSSQYLSKISSRSVEIVFVAEKEKIMNFTFFRVNMYLKSRVFLFLSSDERRYKNMDFFCKLKKLQNMDLIFCKLEKAKENMA